MRPGTLEALDLGKQLDNVVQLDKVVGTVVGTALLARASAMQVLRTEGPNARMQDLAALAIGTMALLDVEVTREAAAGLARDLAGVPSALPAIAAGIGSPVGPLASWREQRLIEPAIPERMTVDWAVFRVMQNVLTHPESRGRPYPPGSEELIERDGGQGVGRLGFPAYRWMRVAKAERPEDRSLAVADLLTWGNAEVKQAMRDSFHWQKLSAGLAPIEPELLLAGMIRLQDTPGSYLPPDDLQVVRATLAVAADMLGNPGIASELGGPEAEISGPPGERWRRWRREGAGGGPLHW
jgi:hypothetical protein